MKKPRNTFCGQVHRREFLKVIGGGFASLGLAGMLAQDGFFQSKAMAKEMPAFVNPLAPKDPHYTAKAKSVIFGQFWVPFWPKFWSIFGPFRGTF